MNVALINANFEGVVNIPNLGLVFLSSYLKKHTDYNIVIIEPKLQDMTEEAVLQEIKDFDFVGLTFCTEARFQSADFAKKVKEINPKCKIIIGGPHIKTLGKLTLEHYPFFDIAIDGEGEESLLEIVQKKPLAEIRGIMYRDGKNVVINEKRPLMKDLDGLPYDYEGIHHYLKDWKDMEVPQKLMELNHMPIIASRGCPFCCAFCGAHQQWEKTWRSLSAKELVDRMEHYKTKYDIGYYRFYDALFIGNEAKISEFCDLLEDRQLDIKFRIDIRVGTKKHILKKLKKVGCEIVGFGVESGSDKILKIANKRITRAQTLETIKVCKKLGYWVIGFFMVSFPQETLEDIEQTKSLIRHFDVVNVQYFKVHPNTTFYNQFKEAGDITDEHWFDRKYGSQTIYGHEVYHCKELFPNSANFEKAEAEQLVKYLYEEIHKQMRKKEPLIKKIKYAYKYPRRTLINLLSK